MRVNLDNIKDYSLRNIVQIIRGSSVYSRHGFGRNKEKIQKHIEEMEKMLNISYMIMK